MKEKRDSETIDLMITEIERLEAENTTLRIGYAKYIAGYRPGDALWSPQDQKAMDLTLRKKLTASYAAAQNK